MTKKNAQELWPGRRCDTCRNEDRPDPKLAVYTTDSGPGREFLCDEHKPAE